MGGKRERLFRAGYPAQRIFYASIQRSSTIFTIHYSLTWLDVAYLLWSPEGTSRKKALLPNEAKLFTPKTACNKLSINNMRLSRFGLAFVNNGVQLHVFKPKIASKWQFPVPNLHRHTTTCSRTMPEIPAPFARIGCSVRPMAAFPLRPLFSPISSRLCRYSIGMGIRGVRPGYFSLSEPGNETIALI
jgi:hypothetical protein